MLDSPVAAGTGGDGGGVGGGVAGGGGTDDVVGVPSAPHVHDWTRFE